MDIIDSLIARILTPQGQIEQYAKLSEKAITKANQALNTATEAVNNIDTITTQTTENNETAIASAEAANKAVEDANIAVEMAYGALAQIDRTTIATLDTEIDTEIKKLVHSLTSTSTAAVTTYNFNTTYPDESVQTIQNIIKYYNDVGQNTDGSMTQKAISDKLTYLERFINTGGSGSSLENSTPGQVVIAGENNSIVASHITEDDLAEVLAKNGIYNTPDAVGLTIDYENKAFERIAEAKGKNSGNDFSLQKYPMYSKRVRCNVNNAGQITAIYGNNNYKDDGTNGDVMVLQPKFYYQRIPIKTDNNIKGKIVRKETICICAEARPGFKLHPAFIDAAGNELEYILLPAYESCYYDASAGTLIKNDSGTIDFNADYLFSCSDSKPVSGANNALTLENAEKLAINKGNGWHITDIATESANQMLALIEFGTLNSQAALESGLTNLPNTEGINCASQTGSTASLGNNTGNAAETINITNGFTNTYNTVGRRAISYRGMENPWGNIWRIVNGIKVIGNGSTGGGEPHIYSTRFDSSTVESIGFTLPGTHSWVSALGYSEPKYDWILMPAEASNANSSLPVGDNFWVTANMSGTTVVLLGGPWMQQDNEGLFYYSCDNNINGSFRSASARIMHIPIYNSSAYAYNIQLINNMGV